MKIRSSTPLSPPPPSPPPQDIHTLKTLEELNRIQDLSERARAIDPTLDPAFKYLFHDDYLLRGLINRALHLPEGEQITHITYQESAQAPEGRERRGVIFDLLVTDQQGRRYEVEVQRTDKGAQLQRVQYYGARLLSAQLNEGQGYELLKPVRVIMLTRFEMFSDPHPARTYYFTPYLITAESAHHPLEARAPYLPSVPQERQSMQDTHGTHPPPVDPTAHNEYAPKSARQQATERRRREAVEVRELMSFTLIELCKDLSELSIPCQRALKALMPSSRQPQKETSPMNTSSGSKRGNPLSLTSAITSPATPASTSPITSPTMDISEDPWIIAFYKRLEHFAGDPQRLAEYERTRRELSDQATLLHTTRSDAHAVGHAEGRAEGRAEGLEEGVLRGLQIAVESLKSAGKTPQEITALLSLTPSQRAALLSEGEPVKRGEGSKKAPRTR